MSAIVGALVGTAPVPDVTTWSPASVGALKPEAASGYGARVPFVEYEAEAARTSGTLVGPDRAFGAVAAEASGRKAVRLDRRGQSLSFVVGQAVDAVTLRAALPDSADGRGIQATLSVFVGKERIGRMALTSRYGWFYGKYPFTNHPADGTPHHFFDEARLHFGRVLAPGTTVRFEIADGDDAPWYVIDLADFERIPKPKPRPPGSLSLLSFGGDPTGSRSSADAFDRAIRTARNRRVPVWIPPGTFRVDRRVLVDRVRILGAGPWYSMVRGDGVGFYGRPAAEGGSRRVELGQFAIVGEVVDRVDDAQRNAIGGAIGGGSYIHDLILQHHKVGLWFDGPMRGIRIRRLRVTDCTADGLNFRRGVSDAVVEDSFWRNTGDDALAAWSHHDADHHIVFDRNTVIAPILANGIAIYGGHDITVSRNLVADTLTEGGGLHLGNRFDAVPASGRILFDENLVVRSGSFDPRWRFGVGAVWLYALDAPIAARIMVRNTKILDSSEEAVQFLGRSIRQVRLEHLSIDSAGAGAIHLQSSGAAVIQESTIRGVQRPAWRRCDENFLLTVVNTTGLGHPRHEGCAPSQHP